MTTASVSPDLRHAAPQDSRPPRSRLAGAFRLQFIVRQMIWVPLMVFVVAWAIALGITAWIHSIVAQDDAAATAFYTGASQATLWTLAFMAAYAASHTFPFALALSYSRRVYMAGTALALLALSAGFGVLFALGAALEQATDGFGIGSYTFALPYLMQDGVLGAGLFATAVALVVMLIGFGAAMLYKRVSVMQMWMLILSLVVVLAVVALLITQNGGWPTVWQWFVAQTPLALSAWLLGSAVVLTGLDYWLIRRATP